MTSMDSRDIWACSQSMHRKSSPERAISSTATGWGMAQKEPTRCFLPMQSRRKPSMAVLLLCLPGFIAANAGEAKLFQA